MSNVELQLLLNANKYTFSFSQNKLTGILFSNRSQLDTFNEMLQFHKLQLVFDEKLLTNNEFGKMWYADLFQDLNLDVTGKNNLKFRQASLSRKDELFEIMKQYPLDSEHWNIPIKELPTFEKNVIRLAYALLSHPRIIIFNLLDILNQDEKVQFMQLVITLQQKYTTHFLFLIDKQENGKIIDKLFIQNDNEKIIQIKNN